MSPNYYYYKGTYRVFLLATVDVNYCSIFQHALCSITLNSPEKADLLLMMHSSYEAVYPNRVTIKKLWPFLGSTRLV
jgi:hypothetical protein